jgi:hypothetical protein
MRSHPLGRGSRKRLRLSDPQARIMKQSEGGCAPSYNVQLIDFD